MMTLDLESRLFDLESPFRLNFTKKIIKFNLFYLSKSMLFFTEIDIPKI